MAIYEITADKLRKIEETTFSAAKVRERADLQRLLRSQIEIISPDTLVIAEEFGEWEDSKRRIDLLGLDKDANLVVFELKRTEDGGHMELQALRYAAMVSTMTFEKVVDVYAAYLTRNGGGEARAKVLEFLGWEEPDEEKFAQDVRIVLVSAEFAKEVTTAVMWLNERELDIRCIRIRPYSDSGRVLVDVQQVIPLPEAADYVVKVREKEGKERLARRETDTERRLRRFWAELLNTANTQTQLHARVSPGKSWYLPAGAGKAGVSLTYAFGKENPRVELWISSQDREENKRIFDQLARAKSQIEARFGDVLGWERLDGKNACRIRFDFEAPSVLEEKGWPELQEKMISNMIGFEKALRPELDKLR
ncbi:MAG: hypothetical protein FD180_152 [Planctomycetota bacterium]|nr:MAG: hypothetical protein FD180_152 [Planctomycetota bacterium]